MRFYTDRISIILCFDKKKNVVYGNRTKIGLTCTRADLAVSWADFPNNVVMYLIPLAFCVTPAKKYKTIIFMHTEKFKLGENSAYDSIISLWAEVKYKRLCKNLYKFKFCWCLREKFITSEYTVRSSWLKWTISPLFCYCCCCNHNYQPSLCSSHFFTINSY